ncbi:Protein ELYS [Lachnellula willkommii]|uniref:Protein ELYS n=1 Tax=Lachnellula willkommii TaxID=215461 RepID=A0A559MKN4_9HELO|nr:Protein ELYS [Lachnellula willkommii]
MDLDQLPDATTIFNYQNFDEVFSFNPECSYEEDVVAYIVQNKKDLEVQFIESVMKLLGIKRPSKYYPPKSNSDLRNLHKAVVESSGLEHHKISVLYYVILNIDLPTRRRLHSSEFERNSFLPPKYSIYMKGLWHLDRQDFNKALEYLTHASLIPTFQDDIVELLVRKNELHLALAYYHTVQPVLRESRAMQCIFRAIATSSVTEALYYSRSQPEHTRRHLFEFLISLVIHNSPKATIADRSVELVNLPFSDEEEAWFEEYLLQGDGRGLSKGKDTLMMRKIGTGKFTESLALKGANGRSIGGLDWRTLSESIRDGLGPR